MTRDRLIALAPASFALIVMLILDTAPLNWAVVNQESWPASLQSLVVLATLGGGIAWYAIRRAQATARELADFQRADEERRTVAAIGLGANWDLDLERVYSRVANDLRGLVAYDRIAITSASPDGKMNMVFIHGDALPEEHNGGVIDLSIGEPDGLRHAASLGFRSKLTVPIPAASGALTLRSKNLNAYGPRELDLMRQVVAQISPGLANARLFQSSQRQVQERTALAEIGRAATGERRLEPLFHVVRESLSALIDFDHMGVILAEPMSKRGRVAHWTAEGLAGLRDGDEVSLESKVLESTTVTTSHGLDPLELGGQAELDHDGHEARSWLRAPLIVRQRLIGLMILSAPVGIALGEEECRLLQQVSLQVAPAIDNARLNADLERQAEERRAIAAIGLAANSDLSLENIYESVADELASVLPYDRFSVVYTAPGQQEYEIAYVRGVEVAGYHVGDRVPPRQHDDFPIIDGQVRMLRTGTLEDHLSQHIHREVGLLSWAQAPLGAGSRLNGFLSIRSRQANAYTPHDLDLLERVANQVAPAIQNARLFAEERELRQQLDQQNHELHEANQARSRFLSTVSHELKTPLTIVSGFINMITKNPSGNLDPEQLDTLHIIQRNTARLSFLINDILDISRVDAGTFSLSPDDFELVDLFTELDDSFQAFLHDKRQKLVANWPAGPIWMHADRNRLAQLLSNILSNASKYSPPGSVVEMNATVDGDDLQIVITDQGMGISKEDQEKLFTAFYRVDNEKTREVPGTGLGLFIARSITEMHAGTIHLESEPGTGTTVHITLPGLIKEPVALEEDSETHIEIPRSRLYPDADMDDIPMSAD
ncbi:MAG: ATP-binding protein [Dehalococcoidia bacterium]